MAICTACGVDIIERAERWPAKGGGDLCQNCWEVECSGSWWEMVEWLGLRLREPAERGE